MGSSYRAGLLLLVVIASGCGDEVRSNGAVDADSVTDGAVSSLDVLDTGDTADAEAIFPPTCEDMLSPTFFFKPCGGDPIGLWTIDATCSVIQWF
jgi:hypothetical protein